MMVDKGSNMNAERPSLDEKSPTVRFLSRVLIAIYLIGVITFGYWYWMRPVRADQFRDALTKWREIAVDSDVPVPKDERWGI